MCAAAAVCATAPAHHSECQLKLGAMAVVIERAIIIKGGSCGAHPWRFKASRIVDGVELLRLDKGDSGFCRFVDGSGHNGLRDYLYFELLRELRNKACIRALKGEEFSLDGVRVEEVVPKTWHESKRHASEFRYLKNKLANSDVHLVEVECPAFEYESETYGPVKFKTPLTLELNAVVEVPVEPVVLEYMRAAIRQGGKAVVPRAVQDQEQHSLKGSAWAKRRNAYVAKRPIRECERQEDTRSFEYKLFRPRKVGDAGPGAWVNLIDDPRARAALAKEEARDLARRWLKYEDVNDMGDDDCDPAQLQKDMHAAALEGEEDEGEGEEDEGAARADASNCEQGGA